MTDDLLFLGLVAAAVGIFGWGIAQVIVGFVRPEDQRLEARLTADLKREIASQAVKASVQKREESLPFLFSGSALVQKFNNHLRQAFPTVGLGQFLGLTGLLTAASAAAGGLAHSLAAGVLAGAVAGAIPFMVVSIKRANRQHVLADQLMDALDFLARVLRAGHSLSTGFQMIGDELPEPIGGEFRQCYDAHSLGQPLESAMLEMAARVDSTDFAFFVTSVLIQRQTGGDLAELLDNISEVVRNRIRLQQHVKTLTAEGRASGYVLTALPAALFAVIHFLNPSYAGELLYTQTGQMLLGGMVVMQIVGLVVMRRIIAIKI